MQPVLLAEASWAVCFKRSTPASCAGMGYDSALAPAMVFWSWAAAQGPYMAVQPAAAISAVAIRAGPRRRADLDKNGLTPANLRFGRMMARTD